MRGAGSDHFRHRNAPIFVPLHSGGSVIAAHIGPRFAERCKNGSQLQEESAANKSLVDAKEKASVVKTPPLPPPSMRYLPQAAAGE